MPEHDDGTDSRSTDADRMRARDDRTGRSAAAARVAQQSTWVDLQVRRAMERGDFDNLPGRASPSRASAPSTIPTGG